MSVVSLLGVKVLNNPAKFGEAYEFEITFECLEQLQKGTLLPPQFTSLNDADVSLQTWNGSLPTSALLHRKLQDFYPPSSHLTNAPLDLSTIRSLIRCSSALSQLVSTSLSLRPMRQILRGSLHPKSLV